MSTIEVRGDLALRFANSLDVAALQAAGVGAAEIAAFRQELARADREHRDEQAGREDYDSLDWLSQHGQQRY